MCVVVGSTPYCIYFPISVWGNFLILIKTKSNSENKEEFLRAQL